MAIPEANFFLLCGCPADAAKHLKRQGLVRSVEIEGVTCESGPNAILLSDVLVQNGQFSNLAEFPLLQMLYNQGMLIPKHPRNTGRRPMLIGSASQVFAQCEYIYRGNYGLTSLDELRETGIGEEEAQKIFRYKLRFAFGAIRKSEELVDCRIVGAQTLALDNGVTIDRTASNVYAITFGNETVSVDLNLRPGQSYAFPYELEFHQFRREYFAVIHSGEGDGWDTNRPCMASILTFQGDIYLIDAGPNIIHTLRALGISISEIKGVFHTHGHDDHFAGLTTLIQSDHKIEYYATPFVRASVEKKLAALLSQKNDSFSRYFRIHDLTVNEWNDVHGLSVRPTLSPHPVETNIFTFRVFWDGRYKTYAHFADLTSMRVLNSMVTDDDRAPGISRQFFEETRAAYLEPCDIKKIDIGGGLIHGEAEDFSRDPSGKIILSHTSRVPTDREREIGSRAPFGMVDVLVPASQDFTMRSAYRFLRIYFPQVIDQELRMLINCRQETFNAGTMILRRDQPVHTIYLTLTGVVEAILVSAGIHQTMVAGSLIGENAALHNTSADKTYCAASFVSALAIPASLYTEFVIRNRLSDAIRDTESTRRFFHDNWLFGEIVSHPVLNKLCRMVNAKIVSAGDFLPQFSEPTLVMVTSGALEVLHEGVVIDTVESGGVVNEESLLGEVAQISFQYRAKSACRYFEIPGECVDGIPILQWKLLESAEKLRARVQLSQEIAKRQQAEQQQQKRPPPAARAKKAV